MALRTDHHLTMTYAGEGNITIALAADDNYVRPLAVAARSVIANLDASRTLTCCVLDMGIEPANRKALMGALSDPRVDLIWDDSLKDRVQHLPETWGNITRASYARLFLPEILPPDMGRTLYLDSDTMARRCVGDLFSAQMRGNAALAVPDMQSPFVSSPAGVPFWYERGRDAAALNFNAGVLLIDLEQWRETDVTGEALSYLTDGRHHFVIDQEALNNTLPERIGAVDPRWNQQAELFREEYEVILPYTRDVIETVKSDPWIVHFSNYPKPWLHGYEHLFAHEWFTYLDQTPFAGWRPPFNARLAAHARRGTRRVARRLGLVRTV